MTTEDEDVLQQMMVDQEDVAPLLLEQFMNPQVDEPLEPPQVISAPDESLFFSLPELESLEDDLAKQQLMYGGSSNNPHMLLMPQQYRARLYVLDTETKWIDIGTGNFRILLAKDGYEHYMQIVSEVGNTNAKQRRLSEDEEPFEEEANHTPPKQSEDQKQPTYEILHRSLISRLNDFQRQRDTIITWQDEAHRDLALSFQDHRSAQNTWFSICFLKGIQVSQQFEEGVCGGENQQQDSEEEIQEDIPVPTFGNLGEIVQILNDADAYCRRRITQAVLKGCIQSEDAAANNNRSANQNEELDYAEFNPRDSSEPVQNNQINPLIMGNQTTPYLNRLQEIFNEVESLYMNGGAVDGDQDNFQFNVTNLHNLFQIYKSLIGMNDRDILELLISDNYFRGTFGALEYDPEVFMPVQNQTRPDDYMQGSLSPSNPKYSQKSSSNWDSCSVLTNQSARSLEKSGQNKADFRNFLDHKVKFREAVKINDPAVFHAIHLSYRLQFLKDTAMARFIDDQTSHSITQLVTSCQQQILEYIFGPEFERIQEELLNKMQSADSQEKQTALKFFMEICQILKQIQANHRFPYQCSQEITKLMTVLAQIFNIMTPNYETLSLELQGDYERLALSFEKRADGSGSVEDVIPPPEFIRDYLLRPSNEDNKLTQLDILKNNSIDIFYNLLMVQNNAFNMKAFLCSDIQKQKNYPFFQNLCRHMLYSAHMGLKVSICEFLKDLIPHEATLNQNQGKAPDNPSRRNLLSEIILDEVLRDFMGFLDEEFKDETVKKSIEFSRCLVLQFLNKLVLEHQVPVKVRMYFIQNKVIQKVCDLHKMNSVHLNVEIIKFLKALLQQKDKSIISFMISRMSFEVVPQIFLANTNKNNMLGSCILSLLDTLVESLDSQQLYKLLKRYVQLGYHKKIFQHPDYCKDFKRLNQQLISVIESVKKETPQQEFERSSKSERDHSMGKDENMNVDGVQTQEQELIEAAFGDQLDDLDQADAELNEHELEQDDEYNERAFRKLQQLEEPQQEGPKQGGLASVLSQLKQSRARAESQQPPMLPQTAQKINNARSARSMSPVRSLLNASMGLHFDEFPLQPQTMGAVDEIDLIQRRERSNSNELQAPPKRNNSKERRSASRENSRGDSSERRNSPLPLVEEFDDSGEVVFQSSQWLKSIKNELNSQQVAQEQPRSPTSRELFELKLGKRAQNSEPLNSYQSEDSNKRKKTE